MKFGLDEAKVAIAESRFAAIRYPSEISRSQRPLATFTNFKANEFRNLLFYCSILSFFGVVEKRIFTHLAIYAVAIRILTVDYITPNDVNNANSLLTYFVMHFKTIYGEDNMDYKLHAHLHYALQVINYGPLHWITCFPFEGNILIPILY